MSSSSPKSGRGGYGGKGGKGGNATEKAPVPKQQNEKGKPRQSDYMTSFRPSPDQRSTYGRGRNSKPGQYSGQAKNIAPYQRGRFVQSCFRLCVEDMTPDVLQAAFDADALVSWENVRRVDLLCEERPKCPICLEDSDHIVVPKITKCGHVFCTPCIMRYFLIKSKDHFDANHGQRCPVCNEMSSFSDLRTVRFQMVQPVRPGKNLSISLLKRDAQSTVVWLSTMEARALDEGCLDSMDDEAFMATDFPFEHDEGWHLAHIVRLPEGTSARLLAGECELLRKYRPATISNGDTELLPSIDTALMMLERQLRDLSPDEDVDLLDGWNKGPYITIRLPKVSQAEEDWRNADWMQEFRAETSTEELTNASPSNRPENRWMYFYQAGDGREVFLQPFFTKLLLHEYGGRWELLPPLLSQLRIERVEELTVSDEVRKRYRMLKHLPVGTVVRLVDVDLRRCLSLETKEVFAEEFEKRRQWQRQEKQKQRKDERKMERRAEYAEEEYYRSLNVVFAEPVKPPTKEDFAARLPGTAPVDEEEGEGEGEDAEEDSGPTLAAILKDKMEKKKAADQKKKQDKEVRLDDQERFPTLGSRPAASTEEAPGWGPPATSMASSSATPSPAVSASAKQGKKEISAWGAGRGSSRVVQPVKAEKSKEQTKEDAWEDGPAEDQEGSQQYEPNYAEMMGSAMEEALRARSASDGATDTTEATAQATKSSKKGKKQKGTTLRLFG